MRVLATALGLATLAFSACDAGSAPDLRPQTSAAAPASQSESGNKLLFESGLEVVLEDDRVLLYAERGGAEMEAGEALALAQAVVYAGLTAAAKTKTGTQGGWPPDQCRTTSDDDDDEDEPKNPYFAVNDSTSGCPFQLKSDPDHTEALLKETGTELFATTSKKAVYALGFWHRNAKAHQEDHLTFKSGTAIARYEDRVMVKVPEGAVLLSPGEALAFGYATAYAGSAAASKIGPMPYPWPPDVCDPPPSPEGGQGWGECPFPFAPGPDLWQAVVPETGIPIAAGDPEAPLVYTFGFWHRPQQ